MLRQTADLADLAWDLRRAPLVDEELPAMGKRLLKEAPDHPKVKGWLRAMAERVEAGRQNHQRGLPSWAPPPEEQRLGHPVTRPTGFRNLVVPDEFAETMCRRYAGRLYVACGLALRGLGQAAIGVNLLPSDHGNLVQRLARIGTEPGIPERLGP